MEAKVEIYCPYLFQSVNSTSQYGLNRNSTNWKFIEYISIKEKYFHLAFAYRSFDGISAV